MQVLKTFMGEWRMENRDSDVVVDEAWGVGGI